MRIHNSMILFTIALLMAGSLAHAAGAEMGYRSPREIQADLEAIADRNKDIATLHILGETPGGRDIVLLELGPEKSDNPAIMLVANMEGNCPPATRGAMQLISQLTGEWKTDLDSIRWYIIPVGNPDGYANFFSDPLHANFGNGRPVNDDKDDATDEDGPDDLNGDGYITRMRQIHPRGGWMAIEGNPVLMKRAETGKGERGKYRMFPEGLDNDGDGDINEDGPGGVIPGHNFPHDFQHYTNSDGLFAASEPESRAVMRFAFDHPEIAMLLAFDRTNSLRDVPESSKKSKASGGTYKLPKSMAKRAGIDPEKEFTMEELIAMGEEFTGMELTEEMVLQFLGVGAAVNPNPNDLPYWNEISDRYKKFMEEAGVDDKRLKPETFPSGSIEEWGYYQYGVPTFSMDFWTLPEAEQEEAEKENEGMITPDELERMSTEEFIALGEEKIDAFLKASGAPSQYTAKMVIMGLQGGMMDTKKMAEMMRKMKKKEEAGGADETEQALYDYDPDAFVAWTPYDHPTLGEVEIGGMIPYSTVAPPTDLLDSLIAAKLPFLRDLAGMIPDVNIGKIEIEQKSNEVWEITAWITNDGFLPYPTHQGKRCRRPAPVTVTIEDGNLDLMDGIPRATIDQLAGSGGTQEATWLVRAGTGETFTITAGTFSTGYDTQSITLEGGGR